MVFSISSPPFIHNQKTTQHIMLQVILACFPGLITLIYFFSSCVIIQLIIACITALTAESIVLILRRQSLIPQLSDGSSVLTALILTLSLPPLCPWWMIVLATAFAIIVAKQLYGGLGQNPFNPAMVGYVVLLISFPVQMTSWLFPKNLLLNPISFIDSVALIFTGTTLEGLTLCQLQLYTIVDGITQATPLDAFKIRLHNGNVITSYHYLNWQVNMGWICVNISFLLGGLYLICQQIITWHISFSFLGAMFISTCFLYWVDPIVSIPPLLHLFSGATMLGAFFVVTDPVTAATTLRGRIIFGALTGFLVCLIRTYGNYPDGVAFATLLANICVPLIDRYTQPRAFGH